LQARKATDLRRKERELIAIQLKVGGKGKGGGDGGERGIEGGVDGGQRVV